MILGAITGVPTPACLSAASNPVEAVTPPFGAAQTLHWAVQRTISSIRRLFDQALLSKGQHQSPSRKERSAKNLHRRKALAQKQPREDNDQRNAELVDRGDSAHRPELQSAEVAKPRKPRTQAGKHEKYPTPFANGGKPMVQIKYKNNSPREKQNDRGADCRR